MHFCARRKSLSDAYLPTATTLLNRLLCQTIRTATHTEDINEATDLVAADGRRIALRVRQPHQQRHHGDVIFRHQPGRTNKSEWEKIIEGWGDLYLYAIARNETDLADWWLLDLTALRYHLSERICVVAPAQIDTGDDGFKMIRLDGFPSFPPIVLASSGDLPGNTDDLCNRCAELSAQRHRDMTT